MSTPKQRDNFNFALNDHQNRQYFLLQKAAAAWNVFAMILLHSQNINISNGKHQLS